MNFKFPVTQFSVIFFLLLTALFFSSCGGDPDCITEQIETFKQDATTCSGSTVIKYRFEGELVYLFSQGNCIADGGATVFDEECNQVCFLGGLVGFTDCNGVNFAENAEELEVLYSVK